MFIGIQSTEEIVFSSKTFIVAFVINYRQSKHTSGTETMYCVSTNFPESTKIIVERVLFVGKYLAFMK